jgi:hypothetical protein
MRNAKSALEHHEFVSGTVKEMMAENAVTKAPSCLRAKSQRS